MALIKCKNCGHMVSDKGTNCPKCGTPIVKTESVFTTNKEEKVLAEVESPKVESVSTVDNYVEDSSNGKKGLVAIVCGFFFIALAIGGYFLWKNYSDKYERQLVDGHPVYSTELVKYAEKGDSVAQCDLGLCYYCGYGIDKNDVETERWFRKSAEQGYARGENNLGICYRDGIGVEPDYSEAERWIRKSAEQGFVGGFVNLGLCYSNGIGVEKNLEEAVHWYRKAAEQGDAEAQVLIGRCYYEGDGVEKDDDEAERWFRKAAEQGNADGQYLLGLFLLELDNDKAIYWLKKAANQGHEMATMLISNR